jgi:hypothetical protein
MRHDGSAAANLSISRLTRRQPLDRHFSRAKNSFAERPEFVQIQTTLTQLLL